MGDLPPVPPVGGDILAWSRAIVRWLDRSRSRIEASGGLSPGDIKFGWGPEAGFVVADGRYLPKSGNAELYARFGGAFGETTTTFAIPNLIGRVIVGASTPGEYFGADEVKLGVSNIPAHSHSGKVTIPEIEIPELTVTEVTPHTHPSPDHNHTSHGHAASVGVTAGADATVAGDVTAVNTGDAAAVVQASVDLNIKTTATTIDEVKNVDVTTEPVGSGVPIDVRQASFGMVPLMKL